MIQAQKKDIRLIQDILTPSFEDNKSVNRSVKQDHKRLERIRNQIKYASKISIANEMAFLNDDKTCAVLCNPLDGVKASVLDDLFYIRKVSGVKLGLQLMKREKLIKQFHPIRPFCHLWYLGVLPDCQGKGIGGKMLREIQQYGIEKTIPIYLETSNEQNLRFYESHGFEKYHEVRLPTDDFKLYFYKWDHWDF